MRFMVIMELREEDIGGSREESLADKEVFFCIAKIKCLTIQYRVNFLSSFYSCNNSNLELCRPFFRTSLT